MTDRQELKKLMRELLIELATGATQQPDETAQWVSLQEAWQPLGYPSYTALYKSVHLGVLRMGKEVRDRRSPGAKIARLQIDITAAHRRLSQDPSKRRGV